MCVTSLLCGPRSIYGRFMGFYTVFSICKGYAPINVKLAGGGGQGMGWGFDCSCWPWGKEFDQSFSPGGEDI